MKNKKIVIKPFFQKYKKKLIITGVIVGVVLIAGGAVLFLVLNKKGEESRFPFGNMSGGMGNMMLGENMLAASGVTNMGITEERFEVENLSIGLKIEEVYVSSEDEVSEGDKVLKLSQESIREAREELEQVLKEADLAYRAGAIEYEQNLITAKYDRDTKLLSGKQAQEIYNETIASLQDSIERTREEVADTKEQIAEYQSYVNNGSYREYFKVDEYQAIYDANLNALTAKMEEWGIGWSQVTGQSGGAAGGSNGSMNGFGGSSGGAMGIAEGGAGFGGYTVSADNVSTLGAMYDVLEQNRKDLDQALEEYEDALANASLNLQTLQLQLPGLQASLAEAEKSYDSQVLQAKLTYETSLANAENAESDYETAVQKAESDYETLKEEWEDAEENLNLFEKTVGDGYFYASGNGTILRTMARAGQNLSSEGIIFMYSNPEAMTVTVSVDQADIAKVAVGDSVSIQSSGRGSFEGVVSEVNPVSGSGSRTNVTYSVTVKFTGDASALGANESVTVIFGMEMPGGMGMPEGMEMPEGFEVPEGFEMPEDGFGGERPQMPGNGAPPEGFGMP